MSTSSGSDTEARRPLLSVKVSIDRPSTPQIVTYAQTTNATAHSEQQPSRFEIFLGRVVALVVSSIFLLLVVLWATFRSIMVALPRLLRPKTLRKTYEWDQHESFLDEVVTKDVCYYAQAAGFHIEVDEITTQDGFILKMHRVVNPRMQRDAKGRGGFPVLIMHGLFQSSGSFITSEERSMAFWLAEQGYQVFLGNNRAVFDARHKSLPISDPRFWDWTIRELALYDFPAMVDYAIETSGHSKTALIAHSQGTAQAFLALSIGMRPDIGSKISLFVALAPAVFAGPLTKGFPFTLLGRMNWPLWRRIFGVHDFIPLMRYSYDYAPPSLFAAMGYIMFSYLFEWTDANWLLRRKRKMFRFTPAPVSSASVFWWCGKNGFATHGTLLDPTLSRWFDGATFPPLAIFHGGRDFLVHTEPLLDRLRRVETDVKVVRTERIELSEHCDFYWAAEAVEWCFHAIRDDIEKTRPRDTNSEDETAAAAAASSSS
ncbi:alpha/beta-hydrolase [Exidia glandulosa HHB12029]|uniref:Alpha/beta-hydrolase n=1 Tax=Exidia glandulosa HHB12029 TaxID=1314781 RepID=A0A166AQS2_EXIGL|nr:alpha/beta-hydrolase [Exidia glandulosa HHB12029]